jgi:hypothetical protein
VLSEQPKMAPLSSPSRVYCQSMQTFLTPLTRHAPLLASLPEEDKLSAFSAGNASCTQRPSSLLFRFLLNMSDHVLKPDKPLKVPDLPTALFHLESRRKYPSPLRPLPPRATTLTMLLPASGTQQHRRITDLARVRTLHPVFKSETTGKLTRFFVRSQGKLATLCESISTRNSRKGRRKTT